MRRGSKKTAAVAAVGIAFMIGSMDAKAAGVRYAYPAPDAPIDFFSPYDESYGTSPSYQIAPYAYGGPAVRVIERCQYPNGWNVTDFVRDVNGIPNGVEHTCPARPLGRNVRARY